MLRYLVAGTGMMGNIITPIIRQSGQEIVGVMEITKELAEKFIRNNGLTNATAYSSDEFDNIVKSDKFDVVAILVPNNLHAEFAIKAAKAGKHVLIEKPLALDSKQAKQVLDAVKEGGVAAEIDSQYRYHELLDRTLKSIIDSEELGKPIFLEMNYIQDWQMNPADDIGWRPFVKLAGKGKLVGDLGSHVLQTTLHLFGGEFKVFDGKTYNVYPTRYKLKSEHAGTFKAGGVPSFTDKPELYQELDMTAPEHSGDDIATANFVLKTEKGCIVPGTYMLSQVHSGQKNNFTVDVAFEKGMVSWRAEEPNYFILSKDDGLQRRIERGSNPSRSGRPSGHPQGYGDAILMELEKFNKVIEGGNKDEIAKYSARNIGNAATTVEIVEKWASEKPFSYNSK